MSDVEFDEIFISNNRDEEILSPKITKKKYQWLVVKVPKRKNLSDKLKTEETEIITWSNGMKSMLIGQNLYDIVSSQDVRDLPVFIDPNSAIIYFGFNSSRATLRPSLNTLSEIKLREDKSSKIRIASASIKKDVETKSSGGKKERKLSREDLEDFLEGESSDENSI
jgi:hypothetical protein